MKHKANPAEKPHKPAEPLPTPAKPAATPAASVARSMTGWIFAAFVSAYLLFLLVPVYFNNQHVMNEICPIFRVEKTGVGLDLFQILEFSRQWFVQGKPLYSIGDNSYPPLEAICFLPLISMNLFTAYRIITLLNVALFLGLTLGLPRLLCGERRLTPGVLLLAATGLFSHGLLFELERGQFNLIAMSFCLAGITLFHRRPRLRMPGYVLFSLAIQLKVYPAIFVLLLVDDWRDWKGTLKRFAALGGANFLALFILGPHTFVEFLKATKAKMKDPMTWPGNHSIASYTDYMRQVYHLPATAVSLGLLALLFGLLGALVYLSWRRRVRGFNPWMMIGCTVAALVLPAVSHDYALSWLAAPVGVFLTLCRAPEGAGEESGPVRGMWQGFGRKLVIFVFVFAYFSTVFSVYLKDMFLQAIFLNNLPALYVMMMVSVGLLAMERQPNVECGMRNAE